MAAEQALRREHERALAREPVRLSEAEKETVRRLAEDVSGLWHAPSTTAADRQAIARTMLDRVVIRVLGDSERAEIECHWAGGVRTRHDLVRPVRRFEQLQDFDRLLARIVEMRREGCTAERIAARLNAEGWRPPKRATFDAAMIRRLLQRRALGSARPVWSASIPREAEDEVTLQELANRLGAHRHTVYGWLRRGRLKGRMVHIGSQRIWLVKLRDINPPEQPISGLITPSGMRH